MSDLVGKYAIAQHDYVAKLPTQLSFKANDVIQVTHEDSSGLWFRGHLEGKADVVGVFPKSLVTIDKDYVPIALRSALQAALSPKSNEHKEKDKKEKKEKKKSKKTDEEPGTPKSLAQRLAMSETSSSSSTSTSTSTTTRSARSNTIDAGSSSPPPLPPSLATAAATDDSRVGMSKSAKRSSHGTPTHAPSVVQLAASAPKVSSKSSNNSSGKSGKSSSKQTSLTAIDRPAPVPTADEHVQLKSTSSAATLRHLTVDNFDSASEYERRARSKEVRSDDFATELLQFPANDLRVVTGPRPVRQCHSHAVAPTAPADADEHLKLALSASVRDFVVVQHKTRDAAARHATAPATSVAPSAGEKDKLLRSPMGGSAGKVVTTMPKDSDREYTEAEHVRLMANLQHHRRRVFELYVRNERIEPIHARAPAPLPEAPRAATQLRVTLLNLKLAVDVGEAFFLAVALYDLRTRQKLSETWHVDLNADDVLQQFDERKRGQMHSETRARSALFGVATAGGELTRERARDFVLVVRIERVACPDEAAGVDLYCRSELKSKDADKARAAAEAARTLLGNVLQPFAWTYARPFLDDDAAPAPAGEPYELRTPRGVLSFDRLFKVKADRLRDDVLCDEIRKRDESTDKSALIPGALECQAVVLHGHAASQLAGRLDTSLRVLQPTPDEDLKLIGKHKMPQTPLVRELCALGTARVAGVQLEYTSHLHVQCEWLDLHNHTATTYARNIVCSISLRLDDRLADAPGAEQIYGGASQARLVAEVSSPLTYRTRRPQYYFEAKVELPPRIPRGAHLLFTFRHVACRLKTGGIFSLEAKEDASTTLGYACLPLLAIDSPDLEPLADVEDAAEGADNTEAVRVAPTRARDGTSPLQVVADGEHLLSVAKALPPHYLGLYVDESPELMWADKKPVFQCRTTLCSSVHTNSAPLALFYAATPNESDESRIRAACKNLAAVDATLLASHFVSIVDQLLSVIVHSRGSAKWAFGALVDVVARIDAYTRPVGKSSTRNTLLDAYLHYLCVSGDAARVANALTEAFVDAWLRFLDDGESRDSQWYAVAWFLLGVLGKSVAVDAARRAVLDDAQSRATRFTDTLTHALRKLVDRLASEMLSLATRYPASLSSLNRTLVSLFCDLFDLMDRGFVFELLLLYTRRLRHGSATGKVSTSTRGMLAKLRLEAHTLLASYEHYVPLNLPLPFELRSASTMRSEWWRRHFLVGLLIDECSHALASDERLTKHVAAATMRSVLTAQSRTSRSGDAQRRVVDMFFPLLQLLCDNVAHVAGDADEDDDSAAADGADAGAADDTPRKPQSTRRRDSDLNLAKRKSERRTIRSPATVTAKGFGLLNALRTKKTVMHDLNAGAAASAPTPSTASETKRVDEAAQALVDRERRDWLACVLFIVSECSPELLTKWFRCERSARLGAFCELLVAALRRFAADGCADMLAREACTVALGAAAQLFDQLPKELTRDNELRHDVFDILNELLVCEPPVDVLLDTFTLVRRFLHEQRKAVFVGDDSGYAANLCLHVLRYCGASNDDVRNAAAALWLRLTIGNMREAGNFSRVKLQSTIAMSSLAGGATALDSAAMKSALEAVVRHVSADDGKRSWALNSHTSLRHDASKKVAAAVDDDDDNGEFDKQLSALTQRLFGVIKNSILLAETKADPEMAADLLHKLSLNYVESPVLRVTWLENLASRHVEQQRWTEAACCFTLIAMLAAAFLRKRSSSDDKAGVPLDDSVFRGVCAHLKLEPGLPESEQAGIYDSPSFHREGLIGALHSAIGFFLKAELFEHAVKLFGVLIAMHMASEDYARLARSTMQLPPHCEKLLNLRDNESRIFAQYYCVSFHGEPWKEFAGRQYIYKAPASERVAEFSERLRARFSEKYGEANFRLLAANESVDAVKSKCAAERRVAFLQIAAVRPHASANTKRKTEFDMNHNVSRFAVEQPFVPGGGAYGETAKQWKRRIVYRCTSTFPHVSSRLLVSDVEERQLSPLACAIETIGGRADQLREEIGAPTPDVKQLQMLLQGSVLLQVNVGPLEIANTFLRADFVAAKDDLAAGEKADALQNKLRVEFRRFIDAVGDAVQLNGTLVESDQSELQHELEKGLERTRAELAKLISLKDE